MLVYYSHILIMALAKWFPVLLVAAAGDAGGDHAADDTHAGEHGGEHGEEAKGGLPHLPNIITLIVGHHHFLIESGWVNLVFSGVTALLLCVVALTVYHRRQVIPGPFQNFIELLVESMFNFLESILGKEAKKYVPFLGTLFFYILINNWLGMIPGGHSPSTSLNVTASMAILVFLYAQYTGMRRLGFGGYLDHMAGNPRDAVSWAMVIIIFPLHIIGELAKPLSLSLRLFGNISGEDALIAVFVTLGISVLAFVSSPVGLPLQLPFYFLGLLLSTVQALVFTLLSSIYILLMLPHEEH